jgi:hypothetical protein
VPAILIETIPAGLLHLSKEVCTTYWPINSLFEAIGAGRDVCLTEDIDIKVILVSTAIPAFFLLFDELVGAFMSYFS